MQATTDYSILVVEDEPAARELLVRSLEQGEGMAVTPAASATDALMRLSGGTFDVVIADVGLRHVSGVELLDHIRSQGSDVDVIMLTGFLEVGDAIAALRRGATDFFTKPLDVPKIAATIARLRARRDRRAARGRRPAGGHEPGLLKETVLSLARASEERDRMNVGHGRRVALYASEIAARLRYTNARRRRLDYACKLHDVGKIGVDDAILNKPGTLDDAEYAAMKRHVEIGEYILKPISVFRDVAPVIRSHHERWDGSGYPDGLSGESIPLDARILCLADYFDAITSKRPYREPATLGEALAMIESESGRVFDPLVVEVFSEIQRQRMTELELPCVGPPQGAGPAPASPWGVLDRGCAAS